MKKPIINLSSLSQKYIMALAGIFLMLFLISHLVTNLLMLAGDGGAAFRNAVSFLTRNPVIKITEYVLFAAFLVHILLGVVLQLHNYYARPVRYRKSLQTETAAFSRYMFHTGVIIFIFLVIHLVNFFFIRLGLVPLPEIAADRHDFYPVAVELFQNKWYSAVYIVSFVFLGFHLKHGFQSAFQSLGINHTKYTPAIKVIGTIYAIAISVGFAIIPVYFLFFYN
ncbi:MAG: succinate dehydrogenase cytochrome b subunit [Bacteroidales bacterium]|nr:succinate dehydrogenase cytochrome b subunit [Bacteroidales bacterium]